jgi:hypothetical protein
MAPTQQAPVPRQSPRLVESNNLDPATVPMVAWEYATLPRVLEQMCMDTTGRPSPQQPDGPRQLSRVSELQRKIVAANVENSSLKGAQRVPRAAWPRTRGKTTVARPNCTTEVRTIKQEMVLACIETYVKVTQTPLQPAQLAQQKLPIVMLNAVLNNNTSELMEMRHLLRNPKYTKIWGKLYTKELGRLAQGVSGTKGTDTIVFIKYNKILLDRRRHITYGKMVVTYQPEKDNPNQTRLTVGGNWIVHHGNVSTPMVKMMTVQMHLNSMILTKGAGYCTFNIKDFYLITPMEQPEYMRMKLSDLPQEFVDLYDHTKIAEDNGNVCMKVQKGMYGLLQAGILAHRLLKQRLNEHGYQQSQVTPGLWKHALRPLLHALH